MTTIAATATTTPAWTATLIGVLELVGVAVLLRDPAVRGAVLR